MPPHRRRSSRRRNHSRSLIRWFLVFGIVGLAVALFMLYALSHELITADHAVIFWPTSMVLLATGGDDVSWVRTLTTALAFGGNFLIYGLLGLLIRAVTNRRRHAARVKVEPEDSYQK